MTDPFDPLQALQPTPYRFAPSQPKMAGPAFSGAFKALTLVLAARVGMWLALLWWDGKFGDRTQLESLRTAGWFVLGWLLMAWTARHVLKSQTSIDDKGLHQSWIWDKHFAYEDLAFGKLIRMRGLDWIVAPRLYVRTLAGKFAVIYAADAAMLAEFERLVSDLKAFRER